MITELAASYLATHFQIPYGDTEHWQYEQSAAYLRSWSHALETDHYAIFRARGAAQAATQLILATLPLEQL